MPNEIVSTYQIWADPAIWQAVGGLTILLILFYWRYRFPESYKHTKKAVCKSGNTIIQIFNIIGVVVSLSILGILALTSYSENTIVAIQTSSPELFAFVVNYKNTAELAFIIFVILLFAWRTIAHNWSNLDNGIIDDPDQKRWDDRKQLEDAGRDLRMAEMERNRQKDMYEMQKALDKITEMYVSSQKAIYESKGPKDGRVEEHPEEYTGPEKRAIVSNPTILLTKEQVLETITSQTIAEEPLPLENFLETETETKKNPKPVNGPYEYDNFFDRWAKK